MWYTLRIKFRTESEFRRENKLRTKEKFKNIKFSTTNAESYTRCQREET